MQALLFFLQAHNLCLGSIEFYAKLAGKFEFEKRDIFKCPRTFCLWLNTCYDEENVFRIII